MPILRITKSAEEDELQIVRSALRHSLRISKFEISSQTIMVLKVFVYVLESFFKISYFVFLL